MICQSTSDTSPAEKACLEKGENSVCLTHWSRSKLAGEGEAGRRAWAA